MADVAFREQQRRDTYAPHVRGINELVDDLRGVEGRGWMPYVAPWHGGSEARVLSVLRDPGPKTHADGGSGFLCTENDDPTAERMAGMFGDVGLVPRDVTPWNAYPWFINRAPRAAELQAGVDPLLRILDLMPKIAVVLLQGAHAQDVWRRLLTAHPAVGTTQDLTVVATHHPGRQALWHRDPAVREARAAHRAAAYREVATAL